MKMPNILGYSFWTKKKKPEAFQLHPATQPAFVEERMTNNSLSNDMHEYC